MQIYEVITWESQELEKEEKKFSPLLTRCKEVEIYM